MPSLNLIDFLGNSFNCPHCGAYAQQKRRDCFVEDQGKHTLKNPLFKNKNSLRRLGEKGNFSCTECIACGCIALWLNENLIFPNFPIKIPKPNEDMPEKIKSIYIEAAEISDKSPRSSAALLRLCLEELFTSLNIKGNNLNDKIGNSNLPEEILKACDLVRLHGNEAIHPGTISFKDNKEIPLTLFKIINYIVDNKITLIKKIDDIYDSLPNEKKSQIKNRRKDNN